MQINVYPHQFVKKLKLKNEFNTKLLFYMAKKKKEYMKPYSIIDSHIDKRDRQEKNVDICDKEIEKKCINKVFRVCTVQGSENNNEEKCVYLFYPYVC